MNCKVRRPQVPPVKYAGPRPSRDGCCAHRSGFGTKVQSRKTTDFCRKLTGCRGLFHRNRASGIHGNFSSDVFHVKHALYCPREPGSTSGAEGIPPYGTWSCQYLCRRVFHKVIHSDIHRTLHQPMHVPPSPQAARKSPARFLRCGVHARLMTAPVTAVAPSTASRPFPSQAWPRSWRTQRILQWANPMSDCSADSSE